MQFGCPGIGSAIGDDDIIALDQVLRELGVVVKIQYGPSGVSVRSPVKTIFTL